MKNNKNKGMNWSAISPVDPAIQFNSTVNWIEWWNETSDKCLRMNHKKLETAENGDG